MRTLILSFLSLFLLVGCQDFNSNSDDEGKYGGITTQDAAFAAAYNILKNRCASCHVSGGYHSNYGTYKTSQNWIEQGLITAGSPDASFLVRQLKNYTGDDGPANMPLGTEKLSDEEYATIRAWITGL